MILGLLYAIMLLVYLTFGFLSFYFSVVTNKDKLRSPLVSLGYKMLYYHGLIFISGFVFVVWGAIIISSALVLLSTFNIGEGINFANHLAIR